jgi:hypothetical protein
MPTRKSQGTRLTLGIDRSDERLLRWLGERGDKRASHEESHDDAVDALFAEMADGDFEL